MKKYLLSVAFIFSAITILFAWNGTQNCANAASYGPDAQCPQDPSKTVGYYYPGATISSVDIRVTVVGTNVPIGTSIIVPMGAPACPDEVKCLSRSDTVSFSWNGSTTSQTSSKIGCGGIGKCNDTLTAVPTHNAGANCTWQHSFDGGSWLPGGTIELNIANANGTPKYIYFWLTCTAPELPTQEPGQTCVDIGGICLGTGFEGSTASCPSGQQRTSKGKYDCSGYTPVCYTCITKDTPTPKPTNPPEPTTKVYNCPAGTEPTNDVCAARGVDCCPVGTVCNLNGPSAECVGPTNPPYCPVPEKPTVTVNCPSCAAN